MLVIAIKPSGKLAIYNCADPQTVDHLNAWNQSSGQPVIANLSKN